MCTRLECQTPAESAYLRARRDEAGHFKYPIKPPTSQDSVLAEHKAALTRLERLLKPVIGAVNVRGFTGTGGINIETLFEGDEDSSILDGLVFPSTPKGARLVVTTGALFSAWLVHETAAGRKWAGLTVDSALRQPDVQTWIVSEGAAVYHFGDLPVRDARPRGVVAAWLVRRAQDYGIVPPDRALVSVIRGGRVFVMQADLPVAIAVMPVCEAPLRAAFKKQFGATDAEWDAYRMCYGRHFADIPGADRIMRQVNDFIDALPLR